MGKSEAKVLTQSFDRPGTSNPPIELNITLARPADLTVEPGQPVQAEPVTRRRKVWKGTATAFALKVKDDWEAGKMPKAQTGTAALRQACDKWKRADGTPFSAKSLAQLLYKKRRKDDGDPL
jgi:hypothetical protein